MIGALRRVLTGGIDLPPDARWPAAVRASGGVARLLRDLSALTSRQRDALMLAVLGTSNQQIARELELSEGTVKQHLSVVASAELSAGPGGVRPDHGPS